VGAGCNSRKGEKGLRKVIETHQGCGQFSSSRIRIGGRRHTANPGKSQKRELGGGKKIILYNELLQRDAKSGCPIAEKRRLSSGWKIRRRMGKVGGNRSVKISWLRKEREEKGKRNTCKPVRSRMKRGFLRGTKKPSVPQRKGGQGLRRRSQQVTEKK